jgi:hypothetical protein
LAASLIIAALSVAALVLCVLAWMQLRANRRLIDVDPSDHEGTWPSVSVIMAARDEAHRIGPAIECRLADDYPDLELVLVDDRSTDGTSDVARSVAAFDPRLRVVRVDVLPEGWLGKVHALAEGVAHAHGDYLLFSDADVHVEPSTTRRAVALCERDDIECLGLVPEYVSGSLLIDAVWGVFIRFIALLLDPRKLDDPASTVAIGSGAFTLVRRDAFERTPGFEHLRMETADDMAVAAMVKQAGGRNAGAVGAHCASVRMYDTVGEFFHGVEKNGSTTAARPWVSTLGMIGLIAVDFAPMAAILVGPLWLRLLGLVVAVVQWSVNATVLRATCRIWVPTLLWPVGEALLAAGVLRATWLAVARGGVTWRGTFYPLEELEAGRRFRL